MIGLEMLRVAGVVILGCDVWYLRARREILCSGTMCCASSCCGGWLEGRRCLGIRGG